MSKTRKWLIIVCLILLCLNLSFIWGNSMLPAPASRAVSGDALNRFFRFFTALFGSRAEKILRKVAHYSEFTSLGILLAALFALLRRQPLTLPLLCGLLAACIDETIQLYSPGRGSLVMDIWIDFLGIVTGIILLRIGYLLFIPNKWRKRI